MGWLDKSLVAGAAGPLRAALQSDYGDCMVNVIADAICRPLIGPHRLTCIPRGATVAIVLDLYGFDA